MPGKGPGASLPACGGDPRGLEAVQRNPSSGDCNSLSGISNRPSGTHLQGPGHSRSPPERGETACRSRRQPKPARPGLQRRWLLPIAWLLIVAAVLLGLSPDAPRARAEGLKLRPAHPRRSCRRPWSVPMVRGSILVLRNPTPTTSRHHADVHLGGRAGPNSGGFQSHSPSERLAGWSRTSCQRQPGYGVSGASFGDYPILGGSPRRLGGLVGQDAAWSPDGRMLVYADGSELFLAKSDGTESAKVSFARRGEALYPAWSPAGNKLRFTVIDDKTSGQFTLGSFGAGDESAPVVSRMAQSPRRMLREMDGGRKILRFPISGADLGPLRKGSFSSPIHGQAHPVDF